MHGFTMIPNVVLDEPEFEAARPFLIALYRMRRGKDAPDHRPPLMEGQAFGSLRRIADSVGVPHKVARGAVLRLEALGMMSSARHQSSGIQGTIFTMIFGAHTRHTLGTHSAHAGHTLGTHDPNESAELDTVEGTRRAHAGHTQGTRRAHAGHTNIKRQKYKTRNTKDSNPSFCSSEPSADEPPEPRPSNGEWIKRERQFTKAAFKKAAAPVAYPDQFNRMWNQSGRKGSKREAAWALHQAIHNGTQFEEIQRGWELCLRSTEWRRKESDGKTPYLTTWLNQARWESYKEQPELFEASQPGEHRPQRGAGTQVTDVGAEMNRPEPRQIQQFEQAPDRSDLADTATVIVPQCDDVVFRAKLARLRQWILTEFDAVFLSSVLQDTVLHSDGERVRLVVNSAMSRKVMASMGPAIASECERVCGLPFAIASKRPT